jgi:glucose/arabinose dehydrogenase
MERTMMSGTALPLRNLFGVLVGILFAALQGCGGGGYSQMPPTMPPTTPPTPPTGGDPQITRTTFMSGLSNPWDMAFAPDGAIFITERCRGLSVRRTNGTVQRLFGTSGAPLVANDLFCEGQSGMHGVAVDPDFASNRYVYVYIASNLVSPPTNRVVRLMIDSNYTTASARTDIVTDMAYKAAANNWGGAGSHSGGRVRFGPDGYLYVTTGDNHNGTLPQDLTRLGGKVIRIDRYGAAAVGNNTPAGGDARIFTYGHRNVQGVTFRPSTAQPFSCEHGPNHTDEVTPLVAGGNSGWDPKPQAGVTCADNYCGYISNRPDGELTRMTDRERFPNAMLASWTNDGQSQGMGPCTFLSGSQWSGWDGRLAVGIMGGQRIEILQLDANGMTTGHQVISGLPSARPRSVVQGPDGFLYVVTDSGEIWRLATN